MGIKIFTGVIPGIACLIGAIILIWFPLKGKKWVEVQKEVQLLHQEKKRKLEEQA